MFNKIHVLILAAGAGKRFGMPKIKITLGEESILDVHYGKLKNAGFENINVIISNKEHRLLSNYHNQINWILNPAPENGMISSIYLGIMNTTDSASYMILPVDYPFVCENTFQQLGQAFLIQSKSIIKPKYQEITGHPIIIPQILVEKMEMNQFDISLNEYILQSGLPIKSIDVDDPGILANINKPDDLVNWQES